MNEESEAAPQHETHGRLVRRARVVKRRAEKFGVNVSLGGSASEMVIRPLGRDMDP